MLKYAKVRAPRVQEPAALPVSFTQRKQIIYDKLIRGAAAAAVSRGRQAEKYNGNRAGRNREGESADNNKGRIR